MKVIFRFVNNPGFGDNIRGLITILQIQKILKFELDVDFSQHVFNSFFIHTSPKHDFKQYNFFIYNSKSNINDRNILMNILNETNLIISTNVRPADDIDEDIKTYIKRIFELKPEINDYLQKKIALLPANYNLFHYRLGDSVLIDNHETNIDIYLQNFKKNIKENAVVISDSLLFKEMIDKNDAYVFLNTPTHTNSNEENIDTLVDFFLITNAKSINCYTNYFWISNFVFWSSIIYDIPLFNIKPKD